MTNPCALSDDRAQILDFYRAIKLLEIGAGTTEVRKLIIACGLLKG